MINLVPNLALTGATVYQRGDGDHSRQRQEMRQNSRLFMNSRKTGRDQLGLSGRDRCHADQ
jgi:hypothetical protein